MDDIRQIDAGAIHRAVHGIGAILVFAPEGLGLALVAYSRTNGSLGGLMQTYSGTLDPRHSFDPTPVQALLKKADWILAHGARELKPAMAALLPEIERKQWVCSSGILERIVPQPHEEHMPLHELLRRSGMNSPELFRRNGLGDNQEVPTALNQVLGLVILLTRGDPPRLGEVLRRAQLLPIAI